MTLRQIEAGDNLCGQKLYFNFPDDFHMDDEFDPSSDIAIIEAGLFNQNKIRVTFGDGAETSVILSYEMFGTVENIVIYDLATGVNLTEYELPYNFGQVNSVYSTHPAMQYIKVDGEHMKVNAICDNLCVEETMTKDQINVNFDALKDRMSLRKETLNLPVQISLEQKTSYYNTFKTVYATMPIEIAKSGAMIRMHPVIIVNVYEDETKAEIVDGILNLYISASDTATLRDNSGRICIQEVDVSDLKGYLPIYSNDSFADPTYDRNYVKVVFKDSFKMYITDRTSEASYWEAAFTYMADVSTD